MTCSPFRGRCSVIASAVLLSIGCSTETPRYPVPAPSAAPVTTVVAVSNMKTPTAGTALVSDTTRPLEPKYFLDTGETTALRSSGGNASRIRGELRIQLLNGAVLTFRDDTVAHFLLPRYAGYLKALHSHVIHGVPMEGSGYYMILDDSTGDSTIVYDLPVPSPDGKRFVVMSMVDAGAAYDPGLIEVWRMVGRKPEKEFSFDTESLPWQPSDPVWRDSITVEFMKNVFVDFSKPYRRTPGLLIHSGSGWIFPDSVTPTQVR